MSGNEFSDEEVAAALASHGYEMVDGRLIGNKIHSSIVDALEADEDYDEERAREERIARTTRKAVADHQRVSPWAGFIEQITALLVPYVPANERPRVFARLAKELGIYTDEILDVKLQALDDDDDEALNPTQWLLVPVLAGPTERIPYAGEQLDDTEGAILWLSRAQPHVVWVFADRPIATIKLLRSAQRHAAPGSEPLTLDFSKDVVKEYCRRVAIRSGT